MDPRIGGQVLHAVVGLEAGAAFAPEYGGAHFGDGRVAAAQALHHGLQRDAGVGQVINEQHAACDLALGRGDVVGNVQVALHLARLGAVAAGGHDGQRHAEDAAEDVAGPHAAARQAQDGVKAPAREVDFEGELFDELVVFVVAHIQVFAVFGQHQRGPCRETMSLGSHCTRQPCWSMKACTASSVGSCASAVRSVPPGPFHHWHTRQPLSPWMMWMRCRSRPLPLTAPSMNRVLMGPGRGAAS